MGRKTRTRNAGAAARRHVASAPRSGEADEADAFLLLLRRRSAGMMSAGVISPSVHRHAGLAGQRPSSSRAGCCERGCDACPITFRGLKEVLEELGHAGLVLALGVSGVLAAWVVITMMATSGSGALFFHLLGDTLWAWFQGVLIGWAVNVVQFFLFFAYFNHAQQAVYAGTKGETAAYPSPGMPSVEYLEKSDSHNLEAVEKCITCGEDTATV